MIEKMKLYRLEIDFTLLALSILAIHVNSLLVVSSTIPFFLIVSEATSAEPSVISTITGLTSARDVAYDPVHERMYVAGGLSSNVYVIDVNTNTQLSPPSSPINIPGSGLLTRIAYDPGHERMYVTDSITNNVYVIDTNSNTPVTGTPRYTYWQRFAGESHIILIII